MFKNLLAAIWQRAPRTLRRWSVRATQTRFTITAAAVIIDKSGRVLLLDHRFRAGSGWGIPGGFIQAGEQPEEALRRELREEVGLEIENAKVLTARTLRNVRQMEIIFLCSPKGDATPQSAEVRMAAWFFREALPEGLPKHQKQLLKRALIDGAKAVD